MIALDTGTAIWPQSVSGWIALITSILSLLTIVIGGAITHGKWIDRMNGYGERLKVVEDEQKESKGADMERIRQFDEMMHDQRSILSAIGRAEKSSEACREELDQHALAIGSRVSEAMSGMSKMELNLSNRLTAVETALKLRGTS